MSIARSSGGVVFFRWAGADEVRMGWSDVRGSETLRVWVRSRAVWRVISEGLLICRGDSLY